MKNSPCFILLLSFFPLFTENILAQDVPRLDWVSQMGGTGYNTGEDIFVDGAGNVYTTGLFWGTVDFDPGAGTFNLTSAGTSDIFVTKQDPSGALIWAVRMGGTGNDDGFSITVDANGNVLTTGHFRNTVDFDPGPGVFNLSGGFYESFISKLDASGNFVWAVKFGEGTNDQNGYSIAVDATGNVYTTGSYINTVDFDPGVGVFNLGSACNDAYVSKLSPNGDFIWAKRLGGTGCNEEGNSIIVDAAGDVIIAGQFSGLVDFDPNAGTFNLTTAGSNDVFVCKLDANGNFVWAKQLGGTSSDQVSSMVMDGSGNLLITGNFSGTGDFDPGTGSFTLTSLGGADVYVCKLSNTGDFIWSKSIGGTSSSGDFGHDIAVDPTGNVYTVGEFRDNVDFDPGTGTFILNGGTVDGFASKLDASGNFAWAIEIAGSGFDYGEGITVDALENVYTTGSFYSANTDFDPTPCPFLMASLGSGDIFIQKLSVATPLPPLHTITSFTPTIGPIGSTVNITGTNFSTTSAENIVTFFNNQPATVTASTTSNLTVTVPSGTTTGRISVNLNCITVQSATNFTVGASPLPTITSFTPTSGQVGTTVTITGTNFATTPSNNTVAFNGTTAVVTASTATSITTSVPAGATTGKITVTIAGNTATSVTDFTVTSPPSVPSLEWALTLEGPDPIVESMTTDVSGNVYTAGQFDGTVDFDPRSGVFNLTSAGNGDAFVSKLSSDGNLIWAFRLGGNGNEGASQIEVDGLGNVYVTGIINLASGSVDFDPGPGITLFGPGAYISKFDSNGNLVWVAPLAASVNDIEIDAANNLYMIGTFSGTVDFDPGVPVFNLTASGPGDFFVMSLTSAGNFVWANRIGGTQSDVARSLALDASDNLCITGIFFSPTVDFDPGAGTANLSITGIADVFILKLDNAGNYIWARRIGSASGEDADGIATDNASNILITGSFNGTLDFDPGAAVANITAVGSSDAFVLKLNSAGNYVWAKSVGGSGSDSGFSITTDADGDVYYTGEYESTVDFDPGSGTFNITTSNYDQTFVSKLDGSGNFLWALGSQPIGTAYAYSPEISLLPSNDIIVAGFIEDGTIDFFSGVCSAQLTGSFNTFIIKLSLTATCGPTISSFTPTSGPIGTTVTITGTNFSTTPANNTVQFNGTTAIVTASTATSITTSVPPGATTGTITVTVAGNTATSASNFTVTAGPVISINTQPSSTAVCNGVTTSFTTAATGTTNITYQWQFSTTFAGTYSDVGNGSGYSNAATASLAVNTTGNFGAGFYRCKINGDLAATVLSDAVELIVNSIPAVPTIGTINLGCAPISITLNPTGASAGEQYKFFDAPTGGNLLSSGLSFTTPTLSVSTTYHVSTYNTATLCESARVPVVLNVQSCNPPVVETTTATAFIEGIVTIALEELISDLDNNLDPSTLQIITQPASGAPASLSDFILTIDYTGIPFPGTDNLEIEICDLTGICTQQNLTIELEGDIEVFNAVSPNNDGSNDTFRIEYIELFPNTEKNHVTIYNRWGDVVWEGANYNNVTVVFDGTNNNGNELPSGTYFYKIDFSGSLESKTGFLSIKR